MISNGTVVTCKSKVKYLGVTIDNDLSGETMAHSVIGKVSRELKVLYRNAKYIKFIERNILCSTLLQSHFDYGYNVWYRGLCKSIKNKLQTSQNRMIRYVLDSEDRFHIGYDSFVKLNWLPVQKRMDYLTLSSMYNIFNSSAPMYMFSQFARVSSQPRTSNLIVPSHNVNIVIKQDMYQIVS